MGLNSPLWRSCDVTATPKSITKYIKLTARTRPLICAIASRGTIYTNRNIGQNVQKWPIFNFVPKWHLIFNFFWNINTTNRCALTSSFDLYGYVGGVPRLWKKLFAKNREFRALATFGRFWHKGEVTIQFRAETFTV